MLSVQCSHFCDLLVLKKKSLKTEKCNLQEHGYFKMTNKLQYVGAYQRAAEVWIAHVICNESFTQTKSEDKKRVKELSEDTTEIGENTEGLDSCLDMKLFRAHIH